MKVRLLFPEDQSQGRIFEQLAYFAARRARTMKGHHALMNEARCITHERRASFLRYILEEEWARDVAEFSFFAWDVEHAPSWLMTELLRHRFIAREWSPEQRSKRAIHGERIPVVNPFDMHINYESWYGMESLITASQALMAQAHHVGEPAEKTRYAALEGSETAFCLAGNARAVYDLVSQRGSTKTIGNGKAHPVFQELADTMYHQAREVCPMLFPKED